MRKFLLKIAAVTAGLLVTIAANAQPMIHPSEHPASHSKSNSDLTVTGNVSLNSDYRFRGFTQTDYGPALQGGIDLSHRSGFYAGNWNSNVKKSLLNGAQVEMDFYGGFKGQATPDLGYDLGTIYYYYPRSGRSSAPIPGQRVKNQEVYAGMNYGPFIGKVFYATSDYFSTAKLFGAPKSTKGTTYVDLNFRQGVGNGLTLLAHVGVLSLRNNDQFTQVDGSPLPRRVNDYKLGLTTDLAGFDVTGAIVGTSKPGYFGNSLTMPMENAGKTRAMLSAERLF